MCTDHFGFPPASDEHHGGHDHEQGADGDQRPLGAREDLQRRHQLRVELVGVRLVDGGRLRAPGSGGGGVRQRSGRGSAAAAHSDSRVHHRTTVARITGRQESLADPTDTEVMEFILTYKGHGTLRSASTVKGKYV